jgi:hypothetical protein
MYSMKNRHVLEELNSIQQEDPENRVAWSYQEVSP